MAKQPISIVWLEIAEKMEKQAIKTKNRKQRRLVHQFVGMMLQISQLLYLFRHSPRRHIAGVTEQLGISPAAVKLRLKWAGLTAQDFQKPTARLATLVRQSQTAGPLLKQVLTWAARQPL